MFVRAATALALALIGPSFQGVETSAAAANYSNSREWVIGPIIRGRNHSQGMPLHPTPSRNGGFVIDLPQAPGSVHYVTFPHGSLEGKRRIVMRYRIQAAPGVRIVPRTAPALPSMITLYFQRAGDNWTARRAYETYRWYATFATQSPISPGVHQIVAPLGANWTAIQSSNARTAPAQFQDAIAEADQVGFVLGGGDGFGHGVYATGPARLIVTEFRVE
ncbi:MAG TPA: hypothetical protein VF628_08020 [Allosphingosinicella sp.]|jgi:hypothetical protein